MAKKKGYVSQDADDTPKEAEELSHKWSKRFKSGLTYQKDNTGQWAENERMMYGRCGGAVSDYDIAIGFGLCNS